MHWCCNAEITADNIILQPYKLLYTKVLIKLISVTPKSHLVLHDNPTKLSFFKVIFTEYSLYICDELNYLLTYIAH